MKYTNLKGSYRHFNWRRRTIERKNILIHSANPKLRQVGIIVFAHVVRTSVRPSPLFKFRKTKQQKTMFATGVTVGLAEWIVDDTCLVFMYIDRNIEDIRFRMWNVFFMAAGNMQNLMATRPVSSMIPSTRPTVPPVVIIIFTRCLFCFAIFWNVGTDVRMETFAKIMITTGLDYGAAEWINTLCTGAFKWAMKRQYFYLKVIINRRSYFNGLKYYLGQWHKNKYWKKGGKVLLTHQATAV